MDDVRKANNQMQVRLRDAYGEAAIEAAKDSLYTDPRIKAYLYGDANITGIALQQLAQPDFAKKFVAISTYFECAADPAPPEGPEITSDMFLEILLTRYQELGVSENTMLDVIDAMAEGIEKLKDGKYAPIIQ